MKRSQRRQHQSKDKEHTDLQRLKIENRELKSEVRTLKKELKTYRRQEHFHEETKLDEEAEELLSNVEPGQPKCPLCYRPTIKEVTVVGRHWFYCEACEYDSRKTKKT